MSKTTIQVRAEMAAISAWRDVLGAPIDDRGAVNTALKVAADSPRREKSAEALGMQRLAGWIADGHADKHAVAAGDVEVTVSGSEIHARIGDAHFIIATNPTHMAHVVKVAEEAAE